LNPNQPNAWLGLGLLAQKQGKLDEAISDLSRSVELQPSAREYFELGRTLAQAGHAPEALDAYQQALKISPDFVEAQQAIATLQQQRR
jgi:tetratricopeptide (TPR) repeat protein